ncbi:MAG: alpha-amylase family glycosyl hydrolase [Candidatus Cryptobacteroides sp.]
MIVYQALIRLFGKGRFSAFDDKALEHLKSLGVSHLWLTGVIRHSSGKPYVKGQIGSPYSISDYYDVNPYLADCPEQRIEEFLALVQRAHDKGLKVLLDFIPNHVSPDYSDPFGRISTLGIHDYDWTDTDKIDYGQEGTEKRMLDILRFWAAKGIDGFRCDMAELVSLDIWSRMLGSIRSEYPELLFIAEVYEKYNYSAFVHRAGFDYLYDKSGLYDIIRGIYAGKNNCRDISFNWQWLGSIQGNMLNFLENHDEQRLASPYFAGNPEKGYAALALSCLFYPTAFMLYFGQEIGEDAHDGNEGRTSIFDKARHIRPCSRLDAAHRNMLRTYQYILQMKRKLEGRFNFDLCYCQSAQNGWNSEKHFAFLRGERCLVACNFSDEPATIRLHIPHTANSVIPNGTEVTIMPWNFTIIEK